MPEPHEPLRGDLQISARPSKIDQKAFTGGLAGMLIVVAAIEVVARLIVPNAYEQSASCSPRSWLMQLDTQLSVARGNA